MSLRELYRSAELPGDHPLDKAQEKLDAAVRKAYGMPANADPLKFLFSLNQELASKLMETIQGPGIPPQFSGDAALKSDDCVS